MIMGLIVRIFPIIASRKIRASAHWSSRSFRRQRALRKDGNTEGQFKITNYFTTITVSDVIDNHGTMKEKLNEICGNVKSRTDKPILLALFENAERNNQIQSTEGHRHDQIKKFASSLYCLMGRTSYETLQANLGCALPSISTLQRNIFSGAKIKEGQFRFDQLVDHLKN